MRTFLFVSALTLMHWPVLGDSLHVGTALAAQAAEEAETEEDEAGKYAGEKGFRQGKVSDRSVEIYRDGKKVGTVTGDELRGLEEKRIFSPRGPKVGWSVVEALKHEGVTEAKKVQFVSEKGRKLELNWDDLVRAKSEVVLTYNFNGELILETNVSDKMPDHMRDSQEDKVREEMHKNRKRSLIFLRGIERIEIQSN